MKFVGLLVILGAAIFALGTYLDVTVHQKMVVPVLQPYHTLSSTTTTAEAPTTPTPVVFSPVKSSPVDADDIPDQYVP